MILRNNAADISYYEALSEQKLEISYRLLLKEELPFSQCKPLIKIPRHIH
jgi:hypothetical protein